jgi:hypothetical protein
MPANPACIRMPVARGELETFGATEAELNATFKLQRSPNWLRGAMQESRRPSSEGREKTQNQPFFYEMHLQGRCHANRWEVMIPR